MCSSCKMNSQIGTITAAPSYLLNSVLQNSVGRGMPTQQKWNEKSVAFFQLTKFGGQ